MGWAEHKIYTDKLAELSNIFNELIYLCDNFDIRRLDKFIINIIENYDYYILEDESNENSDGYSNIDDYDKLSRDILRTDEYIRMIEFINDNFTKMYEKYTLFINNIDSLTSIYLEDLKQANVSIIENFKNEYDAVILNLELLEQKLSYIPYKDKDNEEDKKSIYINVLLVTNNSIMYGIGYNFFKSYFNKNLHVIKKDTYDITYSDEKEFNNKINKIYLNVYKVFFKTLINGKATKFNEEFHIKLKEYIDEHKEESKKEVKNATQQIAAAKEKEIKKNEAKLKKEEDALKKEKESKEIRDKKVEKIKEKGVEDQKEILNRNNKEKQEIQNIIDNAKEPKKKEVKVIKEVKVEEVKEEKKEEVKEEVLKEPNVSDKSVKTLMDRLKSFTMLVTSNPTIGNVNLDEFESIYKEFQPWFEKNYPVIKNKIVNIQPLSSNDTSSSQQLQLYKPLPPPPLLLPPPQQSPLLLPYHPQSPRQQQLQQLQQFQPPFPQQFPQFQPPYQPQSPRQPPFQPYQQQFPQQFPPFQPPFQPPYHQQLPRQLSPSDRIHELSG